MSRFFLSFFDAMMALDHSTSIWISLFASYIYILFFAYQNMNIPVHAPASGADDTPTNYPPIR